MVTNRDLEEIEGIVKQIRGRETECRNLADMMSDEDIQLARAQAYDTAASMVEEYIEENREEES